MNSFFQSTARRGGKGPRTASAVAVSRRWFLVWTVLSLLCLVAFGAFASSIINAIAPLLSGSLIIAGLVSLAIITGLVRSQLGSLEDYEEQCELHGETSKILASEAQ